MGGTTGIQKGPADYFVLGSWNARCWTCFKKCKAHEMKKLSVYDGNGWVCDECFELPNPQQFLKGMRDGQPPPWTQPTPPPVFITGNANTDLMTQPLGGSLVVNAQMVGAFMLG